MTRASAFWLAVAMSMVQGAEPGAQTKGPSIIQSDVREVIVPVVVTDKSGRYVRTLEQCDFQVFENGKPKKIVAFTKSIASSAESGTSTVDLLSQFARETGGQFFENSNDLLKGIRKTFADGEEEYVLVYTPSKPKPDNKFRKISVKVSDTSYRVAAKAGYWASK